MTASNQATGQQPASKPATGSSAALRQIGEQQTVANRFLRGGLMLLAVSALLFGMWAGLIRLGWVLPVLQPPLPVLHGPLMVCGFLGTLIGLERAVGTGMKWAYAGPTLTALGAALALIGVPAPIGPLLITLGSLITLAVLLALVRLLPALFTVVIALGGLAWAIGNILWLAGQLIPVAALWWINFLVLTIAGERLELSRMLKLSRTAQGLFGVTVAILLIGATVGILDYVLGMRLMGISMVAMAAWLLRYDIARRRIKAGGVARFIGISLSSGYVWLAVGGILALWYGGVMAGPAYDATLHAVFLGFVFAMIFAHAPIIFPAVLHVPMAFTPRFYSHLILLHLSLILRVAGDLIPYWPARLWGGMLNVLVLLFFIANTVLAVRAARVPKLAPAPPHPV
jgi:hypothetical protein